MNWFHLDGKLITFNFICTKELKTLKSYESHHKTDIGTARATLVIVRNADNPDEVCIDCWSADFEGQAETLIFSQTVPYIKNQRYEITCHYKDLTKPVVFKSDFKAIYPVVTYVDDKGTHVVYECKKMIDPIEARKELNMLKKKGLVSVKWDSFVNWYGILCEACHTPGSSYAADIEFGRVFFVQDTPLPAPVDKDKYFVYLGNSYKKIPEREWLKKRFYNRVQWEQVALEYKPTNINNMIWCNREELESHINKYHKEAYYMKDFDEWCDIFNGFWRMANGQIFKFTRAPTVGSYERVCSPALIEWYINYDFDLMWKNNLEQCEIDENAHTYNDAGGAWRFIGPAQKVICKDAYELGKEVNKAVEDSYEKVVFPGWHNTYIKGSIECPVCKRTYELERAIDIRTPLQRLLTQVRNHG